MPWPQSATASACTAACAVWAAVGAGAIFAVVPAVLVLPADAPDALAQAALADASLWGEDLTLLDGFAPLVASQLSTIAQSGMRAAIANALAESEDVQP